MSKLADLEARLIAAREESKRARAERHGEIIKRLLDDPKRCGKCRFMTKPEYNRGTTVIRDEEWQMNNCSENKTWVVTVVNCACERFEAKR